MRYFLLILLLFPLNQLGAQSRKDIRKLGIREVREYKLDYKDGQLKAKYLKELRKFDRRGNLILEERFMPDSSLEWRETFTYAKDLLLSEVGEYPNKKQSNGAEKHKRYNYNYSRNEVIEELKLDTAGNVVEKTIINRNRFGDKSEELKFDGAGKLKKRVVYEYNKLGLRTRKSEFKPGGELKEETLTEYILR
jgi:hypothetical protein